jgi:type II secretory pathway component GspD/PulD (secretin)
LQTIQYNGDLEGLIRKLADELELNVVFDQNFSQIKRNVNIRWKDITPARALDYVFLANGLFFQKLDRRTILVADQSKRPMYQQLVLRTFYLYNIKPEDAQRLLSGALPANAGRQPQFMVNPQTNSITVRDTPENIRIIEQLLKTVDKDRSEVVMEVAIYEVSRNDLMQLGNQVGTQSVLEGGLGGISAGSLLYRGTPALSLGTSTVGLGSGIGLLIPASQLSAFQSKSNTRLLFSTAVHAFDDEKSSTRVGSKVPVQTASVYSGLVPTTGTGTTTGTGATANNLFGSGGYPVIQYEDVGLNLDFKPKVFPNQDVQVSMSIESKDEAAGPDPLTPIFTQRKIDGVARIPNGKTMMIASIAQDRYTNGRQGLPLVGLVPILGRLFTAPNKNDQQSDIVITMTPRVLRAPEITPDDLKPTKTGTMQTPESPSLEAMVKEADKEDQYARLRSLPTNQSVQLTTPTAEDVSFVPAPKALAGDAANSPAAANASAATSPNATGAANAANAGTPAAVNVNFNTTPGARPAVLDNSNAAPPANTTTPNTTAQPKPADDSSVKPSAGSSPATNNAGGANATTPASNATATPNSNGATAAQPAPTNSQPAATGSQPAPNAQSAAANAQPVAATVQPAATAASTQPAASGAPAVSTAELMLLTEQQELKVGERRRVMLFLKTDAPLGLATATLRFDPKLLAVRSVSQGVLAADKSLAPVLTQSVDPSGVLLVSVSPAAGAQPLTGEGLLVVVEVEALAPGDSGLQFDADKVHLIATDGRTVNAKVSGGKFKVTQ